MRILLWLYCAAFAVLIVAVAWTPAGSWHRITIALPAIAAIIVIAVERFKRLGWW